MQKWASKLKYFNSVRLKNKCQQFMIIDINSVNLRANLKKNK